MERSGSSEGEWKRLAGSRWSVTRGTAALIVGYIAFRIGSGFARPLDGEPRYWPAAIGLGLVFTMVVFTFIALLTPQPEVNLTAGLLRVGRRRARFEDISWAMLDVGDGKKERNLWVRFGDAKGLKTGVVLRTRRGTASESTRNRLVRLFEMSSVEVPTTKYDPSGKFARYNFPGSLTRQAAIDVVRNPPALGEPLPVLTWNPVPGRLRKTD